METFSALLALLEGNSPLTKASDAELWCFLWFEPEEMVEQTIETPVILYAIVLIMISLSIKAVLLPLGELHGFPIPVE